MTAEKKNEQSVSGTEGAQVHITSRSPAPMATRADDGYGLPPDIIALVVDQVAKMGGGIEDVEKRLAMIFAASQKAPRSAPYCGPNSQRGPSPIHLMKKLADIMSDLNWVEKRGHNSHFNYDYATESDIMAAVRPRLAEAGIFVQTLVQKDEKVETGKQTNTEVKNKVFLWRVELLHIFHDSQSGETMEAIGIGYSEDSSDKGFYKAYTGACKYTFSKLFLISSGDDPELEGDGKKAARKEQRPQAAASGAPSGPQRTGGVQVGDDGQFNVTSAIEVFDKKATRSQGVFSYQFQIPNVGKATTTNAKLGESLAREKGTGMLVRWTLSKNGSWLNIVSAEVLPSGISSAPSEPESVEPGTYQRGIRYQQ